MDERTQMVAGMNCPVCGASNSAGAVWCVDCGFRVESTPGEMVEPAPGFALLGEGESYPLKHGDNVVGRIQADVFLSDPSVSRRHAVVTVGDEGVVVRDEGSSNGTRVGALTLASGAAQPVQPGQSVQFGTVVFRLSAPDGTEAPPPDGEEIATAASPAGTLEGDPGVFPLKQGANSVGRRPGNDVVIPDPYVSGFHAVLRLDEGRAVLVDSGSSNGTYIGERRLMAGAEETVEAGCEIRFGRALLRFVPANALEEAEPDVAGA